jgi:hypothetical protein
VSQYINHNYYRTATPGWPARLGIPTAGPIA